MTKSTDGLRGPQSAGQPASGHTSGIASPHLGGPASSTNGTGGSGHSGMPFVNPPHPRSVERKEPVVIKKYANRRLYNTETSTYVTLDDLAAMVRNERDFLVYDAKTGDDLTHTVLTQIIVEQESRMTGGETLLPIPFLRQLIRFYGAGLERMVPSYLQVSLEAFVKEQERFRTQFASAFTPAGALEVYQDQARRNMAVFEQAMSMFVPFNPASMTGIGTTQPVSTGAAMDRSDKSLSAVAQRMQPAPTRTSEPQAPANREMAEMRAQMADMQAKIEKLSKRRR